MKIDRLLSIIVYLLNHELVSARRLAERFSVSTRTIIRDMETIDLAGIPVISVQGPEGGYGISESYKMDRRLMSGSDLCHIITALQSLSDSMGVAEMDETLEKMKGLLPQRENELLTRQSEQISMDFSLLGGDPRHKRTFSLIREALDRNRLLKITYTSNKLESTARVVEPMTIAFKWRSWYLFAWCREREDYRLFRLSRIKDAVILDERFRRREFRFEEYIKEYEEARGIPLTEMTVRFSKEIRALVEEYCTPEDITEEADESITVKIRMPGDSWLYGFILSYGPHATVLEPEHIRLKLGEMAREISKKYDK